MSSAPSSEPVSPPPPPSPPPAAPPPPPARGPAFDATVQARALLSHLDPSGLRPTFAVAGVIIAIFLGAQLLNAILPVSAVGPGTPLPPGSALPIGPLRVPLEPGWVTQEVPGSSIVVRLVKGSVAIDVFSVIVPASTDAGSVYTSYLNSMALDATGFGATAPSPIQIGNGNPAVRGTYTGVFGQNQVEGEVTALVHGGSGWIFDVWASSGTLRSLVPEAERMIDNTQVQP